MKQRVDTVTVQTAEELIDALIDLKTRGVQHISIGDDATTEIDVNLIEETLSDGSLVYDIQLTVSAQDQKDLDAFYSDTSRSK